jgi:hypothetical protein
MPVATKHFENGPQYYRDHEFHFLHPPVRADWWALCQVTPWMKCFEDRDRQLIDSNPWPLVGPGKKGCTVDLMDAQGRRVGMLDVHRQDYYLNSYPPIPGIGVDNWSAMIRGLKGVAKDQAHTWVMLNDHLIQEAVMNENKPMTDALIVRVGKRLLREQGIIKSRETKAVRPGMLVGYGES